MITLVYRFILWPLREIYRKTFRPKTHGVKVLIRYNNELLLIRNTYGRRHLWTLPGGGVQKNESFAYAAKREVKEEVGIKLKDIKKLGLVLENNDTKHIFLSTVQNKNFRRDKVEIAEVKWFSLKQLPEKKLCSFSLQESLKLAKIS